ncbi:MAG: GGDEF domain-containing protein [Firmicutes bacterium]|nr:GGDEF domain-containing protein [Bacillota bacterium]
MGKNRKEVRIVYVFGAFFAALLIIAIILLVGSSHIDKTITDMQESTDKYIVEQNSISQMREISDYLTEKCQSFVSTGDLKDAKAYFKEVEVDKHREASLESVEKYGTDDPIYESLTNALQSSNDLTVTEFYAMRLAAEGYDMSPSDIKEISEDLTNVKLTEEDAQLTQQQKRQKARSLVFGDEYEKKKAEIWDNVLSSTERLMENTRDREVKYYNDARSRLIIQNCLMVVLLALALFLFIITAQLIIFPLTKSAGYIRNNKKLPVRGAAEYTYLARAYNRMLEATQEHHELLSYEATHDEMTGLYNRKFFDMKHEELAGEETALMIVDVDHFKSINDTYGHETGDKVLKKVSGILASSFRSEDFVCRIGGDEFAVLMVQMHPNLRHVIEGKIAGVNEMLKSSTDDGLPAVTLSIGSAFSVTEEGAQADSPEELFRKADKALYQAKEAGRNSYAFYEEDTISQAR